ncbi:MAG TPA: DUF5318 family protein [Actinomycetes bacterium]|nr:DUF5318 family protein [Actinomycetes bacterium]
MEAPRAVVDYGLARRAALTALRGGGPTTREDVCDAHPYLVRAARHHGEQTGRECPVCRRLPLTEVRYVYGDELGGFAGRVKTLPELAEMAREHAEFRVYVVEVCAGGRAAGRSDLGHGGGCGWNHLVQSYVLGDGVPRETSRRRTANR